MAIPQIVITWALMLMLKWAPAPPQSVSGETEAERLARFNQIALTSARVVYDSNESPIFSGERGRGRTLALVLSVAFYESAFRRDVDLGIGPYARGGGKDSCLLQVRVAGGSTREGWTHADLVGDREKCIRSGLHIMQRSFSACRALPLQDRLAGFTRGTCSEDKGSRLRVGLAMRSPLVPVTDSEVLGEKAGGS